jgi:hypothetical protein
MADVFPKFIIETDDEEGDCLIIARCTFHKQLVTDISKVKGGGFWSLDENDKTTYTLYGSSHDFGRASIDDITACIKNNKVFTSASLHRKLENFKFIYKHINGEHEKLN